MPLDLSVEALNQRVDALRTGWAGHQAQVLERNRAFLRAFSPEFESKVGELDQWPDPFRQEDEGHARNSYNMTRAVVELWSSLELSELPVIRWVDGYVPAPAPTLDEMEQAMREQMYRAAKLVARQVSTMREQTLLRHVRRTKLKRHAYKAVTKKNIYGHSWLKTVPDRSMRSFRVYSRIDPSTVYPVWSFYDDRRLDAVLVAYRRSVQSVNAQWPGLLPLGKDGISVHTDGYYNPTNTRKSDADLRFVWVEDYWVLDDEWEEEVADGGEPIRSRVVNFVRVNGKPVPGGVVEYPGWRAVPYVLWMNDNERDNLGFSDAGTMLPFQSGMNRFMSRQEDVIEGEARPKFKYRGDADRQITLSDEEVISLDPDEDIEQIAVRLDVFPTQVHGQQLMEAMGRATGLPDTVWGRIVAAQNSGRALATAWRSVAARNVPRTYGNEESIESLLGMWLDWMELYGWDGARDLYNGNRDFELDFPNQEPRDFTEVIQAAVTKFNAGGLDTTGMMEEWGEKSPDEMLDRIRAEYSDAVLHPDKKQGQLMLRRLEQAIMIEAMQAGLQQQAAQAQLAQLAAGPPAGAPGPGNVDQQAAAARQAQVQAAQQRAPVRSEADNAPAPATGPQSAANGATKVGTLLQDGSAFNRVVEQGQL